MIGDSIQQLRVKLSQADALPEATRAELLALVAAVEREAMDDSESEAAPGEIRSDESPALGKLVKSVEELEASHPEVVASINQVAAVLGKMGI